MKKIFYFLFIFLSVILIGELFWLLEKMLFVKYNLENNKVINYLYSLLDEITFIIILHFLSCVIILILLFRIIFRKKDSNHKCMR